MSGRKINTGPCEDDEMLQNGFKKAIETSKSKKKTQSIMDQILKDPQELANAREFAANNPQMARQAKSLKGDVTSHVRATSQRKQNQLARLNYGIDKPEVNSGKIQVVRVSHGNGKLTSVQKPLDSKIEGWERIQFLEDYDGENYFILFDPQIKSKNKKANLLFSSDSETSVGGDVYIFTSNDGLDIQSANLETVKDIFQYLESQKKTEEKKQ